jgi:8-oxo-dGTP pyrophosphatase MutT (NUDIX family)/RimJ/RimL family protein N-acetyltransferase
VDVALRPLTEDDNERLTRWLADDRILEFYEERDTPYPVVPLLIEDGRGEPVGYAQHFPVTSLLRAAYRLDDVPEVAELRDVRAVELFIAPERWGEGIGGAALGRLLDTLFAEGADAVVVDPAMANQRANRIYERAGFRRLAQVSQGWLMVARPPGTPGPRQQVPRPLGARAGQPAPWSEVPPDLRRGIRVDHIRAALDRVGHLETFPAPFGRVAAAVLIPVFEEDGEARLVLTRRSSSLRAHRGEVSFPGGRIEPDESPLEAALREAEEEVGITGQGAEVLGKLAPLATLSSSSSITPFLAVLPERPVLQPNPAEVELAFDVAIADLLADGVYREERWDIPGGPTDRPVHFFSLPDDLVWGATARILHELLSLVVTERSGPPVP